MFSSQFGWSVASLSTGVLALALLPFLLLVVRIVSVDVAARGRGYRTAAIWTAFAVVLSAISLASTDSIPTAWCMWADHAWSSFVVLIFGLAVLATVVTRLLGQLVRPSAP